MPHSELSAGITSVSKSRSVYAILSKVRRAASLANGDKGWRAGGTGGLEDDGDAIAGGDAAGDHDVYLVESGLAGGEAGEIDLRGHSADGGGHGIDCLGERG